ncbi:MAG: NUDIX hydrolase [Chloroflexota bacterium]|nr:NUDIX hydrolase [Chloroflexota bacterium]
MSNSESTRWLQWAQQLQAISQTGLTYSTDAYDIERFRQLAQIAAEIVAVHTHVPVNDIRRYFLEQRGYATPKVDVRGAIVVDHKILLVQERSDEQWCLPGGWADVGETPSAVVIREVAEESGLTIIPQKVIGIYDANRHGERLELSHAYKIVFLCEYIGGELQPSTETLAAQFFSFEQLPPLSSNRTSEHHLAHVRAHLTDPQRPTHFD